MNRFGSIQNRGRAVNRESILVQRSVRTLDDSRSLYEKAVGNMKEVADLIQKSNQEALGLLNKRFTEAMDEVKTLVVKKG